MGMYLVGYGGRAGGATSVHDDLTATALVLDDGQNRAAIITLDILGLNWEVVQRARAGIAQQAGIPAANVFICASHTHSGPVGYAPAKGSPGETLRGLRNRLMLIPTGRQPRGWRFNRRYIDGLVETLARIARQAAEGLAPACLAWGRGETHIGHNRRERLPDGSVIIGNNPDGPIDRSVTVVQAAADTGPLATLANIACHATVIGPDSYAVSADWVGAMRARAEDALGGPVMFVQGAAGDINPQHEWTGNDWPSVAEKGQAAADEVVRVCGALTPLDAGPIRVARGTVWVRLLAPETPDGSLPDYRRQLVEEARKSPEVPAIPLPFIEPVLSARYPWKTIIEKRGGAFCTPVEVGVLRVGGLALASISMEPFTEIGLAVKAASPADVTLLAGYTDGLTGYLATASEHALGGYEIELGPYFYRLPGILAPEAGEETVAALRALLEETA
jgi:hypothetical protein